MSVLTEPSGTCASVTPSDTTLISPPFRSLYIGAAGNIAVTTANGNVVTFLNVPAGSVLPVYGTRVMATNTTGQSAGTIIALQ